MCLVLDRLDAEPSRWMLRQPVALGLGIAIYSELPGEPALWPAALRAPWRSGWPQRRWASA